MCVHTPVPNIEQLVIKEFEDAPIMIEVAYCESRFRMFNKEGEVLRGEVNPLDVGIFQVNEFYHLESSKNLDIDIHTIKGNLQYARYLYDKNSLKDWAASRPCWEPRMI